ncbi:DUF2789 domain-containing protein [Shewanella sp. Isolate11]|uniref:DUF2789 domain-containing protein n=1 Tax=Shewanella sp. Isolate11 TaxID=2908530 RepID=UPI001EFDA343|nr:DUF2789 domain-containing protein [Shewanella sp. Isolate11]MCG9696129.1 DUF2789 domain-containing protein [Shewanella sp. Isolate11]
MDINQPNFQSLFDQLGLPSSEQAIEQFISQHNIDAQTHLVDASFWTQAQKHFIKEALEEDAMWTEIIDQLDAQLRG